MKIAGSRTMMKNEGTTFGNKPQPEDGAVSFSPPRASIADWIGCFFLTAIVLVHFGLVGLGQWLNDEYLNFGRLAGEGWYFLWERLKWSPRPLSEPLFCAYGWLVIHWHRPLTGIFLGTLWAGLMMAGLLTFWQNRRRNPGGELWPDLLVGLALLALFVAGAGHVLWVFYWPAAAVAYLPTLAATLLLFLQVARGRLSGSDGQKLCSCCLLVAACSSESGAMFVFCYGLLQGVEWVVAAFHTPHNSYRQVVAWWLLPTVISAAILFTARLIRFQAPELRGLSATSGPFVGPLKGHAIASVIAGLQELFVEALGRSAHLYRWHGFGSRLPSEILLALGVGLCWSRFGRLPRALVRQILAVVGALLLASLLTIAAAYLHFGVLCCPHHELLRRCWILLSIAGLGMLLSGRIGRGRLRRNGVSNSLAQMLLCGAVLSAWHIRPVMQTYRMYSAIREATRENFEAGFNRGDQQMIFLMFPDTLIAQPQIAPGRYTQNPENPPDIQDMLRFYQKSSIIVRSSTEWFHDPQR